MTDIGQASIFSRIRAFNKTFGMPAPAVPTIGSKEELRARLVRFHEILQKEMQEHEEILMAIDGLNSPIEVLTMMADWYMDIVVYCISEAMKTGIPCEQVLHCIMDAQASKLAPDGTPIMDNGKVIKGPNYVAPEPRIKEVLEILLHANNWGKS